MTFVSDLVYASVNDAIYDIASIDNLAFELDSMFDILVFEADLPHELENENCIEFRSDFDCITSFVSPDSLPSALEAPIIQAISPIGIGLKPRPPPSPNIVVLDALGLSKSTKETQLPFQTNRKFSNFDKDFSVPSSTIDVPRETCVDSQLLQEHLMKKQHLPPESEQQINLMVHGSQPNDTGHSIGKPDQPAAPPSCHTYVWHQSAPFFRRRAPSYASSDRLNNSMCHKHSVYKPWGEKKVFMAHIE